MKFTMVDMQSCSIIPA